MSRSSEEGTISIVCSSTNEAIFRYLTTFLFPFSFIYFWQHPDELTFISDTKAKDKGPTLTLDELCAQAFGFYIAGYETTSSTLTYLLYHVARNPEVQKRLHQELDHILQDHPGEVRYESMMKMTYMTQVIKGKLYISLL